MPFPMNLSNDDIQNVYRTADLYQQKLLDKKIKFVYEQSYFNKTEI